MSAAALLPSMESVTITKKHGDHNPRLRVVNAGKTFTIEIIDENIAKAVAAVKEFFSL
jgi:hypothetical protein